MPSGSPGTLVTSLIATNDLIDEGFTITMGSTGGSIINQDTGVSIPLYRDGRMWTVSIPDLAATGTIPQSDTTHNRNSYYSLGLTNSLSYSDSFSVCPTSDQYIDALLAIPRGTSTTTYSAKLQARKLYGAQAMARFIELHERCGHLSARRMQQALRGDDPTFTNCGLTHGQIHRLAKRFSCTHCILAKRRRLPVAVNSTDPSPRETNELNSRNCDEGEIISVDVIGQISPATVEGYCYFFLFRDVASGYCHCFPSRSKDAEHVLECLKIVISEYAKWGYKPKILRSDSAREFIGNRVETYLSSQGLDMLSESSIPYQQWQNAVERDVQEVVRGASTLLHAQTWLRADCWDLALKHYVDLRNRCPNSRHEHKSPRQRLTKEHLDFNTDYKFAFGDFIAVDIQAPNISWKFDLKNEIAIYVGQPPGTKGACLVYYPASQSTAVRYHCTKVDISDREYLHYYQKRADIKNGGPATYKVIEQAFHDFRESIYASEASTQPSEGVPQASEGGMIPISEPLFEASEPDLPLPSASRKRNRRNRDNPIASSPRRSARLNAFNAIVFDPAAYLFSACAAKVTVSKALKSLEYEEWIKAIRSEVDQLIDGGTLEATAATDILEYSKIIHSTMQLKHKQHASGLSDKYKGRLCACGNELYGSIAETYSPTIGALAYATVHQLAIIDSMHMCTVDTVGAYLYQSYPCGPNDMALYLSLPDNVAAACGLVPGTLYRIRKYLYGLPDSGRAYYTAYSTHLIEHGYIRSISDPCLFYRFEGNNRTYIWIHVDDTFVCATDPADLVRFQNCLKEKFEITVNTNVTEYLGISMTETPEGIQLTQPKLLKSVFEEFLARVPVSRSIRTPQRAPVTLPDTTPMSQKEYLHLLGALIYLTKSRPDIATAVSFGATFAASPTVGAFADLLHCVGYLYDTQGDGLILLKGVPNRPLTLTCYVDASYLTHSDSHSHTGYCLSLGERGSFYSKSTKQTLVATSSTHAEVRALYSLANEIIFVVTLCKELQRSIALPAIIMEDNKATIDITADYSSRTKRCKHFLMLVHYIREHVKAGLIEIRKVDTNDNVADVLTKIKLGSSFFQQRDILLGVPSHSVTLPAKD